jgi:hypothetical protein
LRTARGGTEPSVSEAVLVEAVNVGAEIPVPVLEVREAVELQFDGHGRRTGEEQEEETNAMEHICGNFPWICSAFEISGPALNAIAHGARREGRGEGG